MQINFSLSKVELLEIEINSLMLYFFIEFSINLDGSCTISLNRLTKDAEQDFLFKELIYLPEDHDYIYTTPNTGIPTLEYKRDEEKFDNSLFWEEIAKDYKLDPGTLKELENTVLKAIEMSETFKKADIATKEKFAEFQKLGKEWNPKKAITLNE